MKIDKKFYGIIMIFEGVLSHRFIINFAKYKYLLSELVKRDIKVKYRRSVLGIFWSFLEPLLFMIALTLIFSTIFKSSIQNFPVYILTGRLAFDLFAKGTGGSLGSMIANASMIKKIYVPKYMYVLGVSLSSFVTFLLSLIVLFLVMIATHAPFTVYIFLGIIPIILLLIFTIGIGLILATLTVFFRDMKHLYNGVFLLLLMYGSAIFYPPQIIPAKYQFLLTWNPLYAFISLFRDSFMYGKIFDIPTLSFAIISTFVALIIGMVLFYKYQDKFILYI